MLVFAMPNDVNGEQIYKKSITQTKDITYNNITFTKQYSYSVFNSKFK